MARFQYVIVSQAKPGREEDYKRWYAEQHLHDVSQHPHVVSAPPGMNPTDWTGRA